MQSHIRKVRAYLAVTYHLLHFWQNERDLLPATKVYKYKDYTGNLWCYCGEIITTILKDLLPKFINTKIILVIFGATAVKSSPPF